MIFLERMFRLFLACQLELDYRNENGMESVDLPTGWDNPKLKQWMKEKGYAPWSIPPDSQDKLIIRIYHRLREATHE